MTNAVPPPRRPRPGPGRRPVAVPSAASAPSAPAPALDDAAPLLPEAPIFPRGVVVLGEETIRVPGLAALLRRHPRLTQRGGIAAVAGGILLFVVAGLTTPVAGANTTAPKADVAAAPAPVGGLDTPPAVRVTPAAPVLPPAAPVHSKKQAPVGHGVISGLAANGIPRVALNAYRVAAARMANVQPGCGIDWSLLAGIGREESDHGRFAGAVLHADGVSTPKIIGPALDGARWDYIAAPANGRQLDGDATFAHALGPMQFIPSTWALYGTDATGDGKADIFNINDAALGAARYLCAAGGNLRTHDGQVRAVLAYNHNDQYLAQVLALADAYRTGVPVSGIPVGITTGALPKVTDTGYIPPANPGAPTAVDRSGGKKSTPKPGTGGKRSHPSGGAAGSTTAKAGTGSSGSGSGSSGTGSAGGGSAGGGSAPSPAGSTPAAPKPSGSTSGSAPAPAPSPSPTCNAVQSLLGCKG